MPVVSPGQTEVSPNSCDTRTGAESQPFAILMRFRDDKIRWIGTFINLGAARDAWELGVGADEA